MFERFSNNFQNTVAQPNTNFNPYDDQYFGQNDKTPYIEGVNSSTPQPMTGNLTEQNLYPLESSLATPYLNTPIGNTYKQGGKVQSKKTNNNPYPYLAEMIRQQGKGKDTILAHINPIEAQILKALGGSGTINPKTGLPQFFLGRLFTNPIKTISKAFKKPAHTTRRFIGNTVAPIGGAILGNMILPGIGGIIGGGLGGGVGASAIGKKFGSGALMGSLSGAMLPTLSSAAGWGAGKLGASGLASSLTNYGNTNAILPALGLGGGSGVGSTLSKGTLLTLGGGSNQNRYGGLGVSAGDEEYGDLERQYGAPAEKPGFLSKLMTNTSDFLSQPSNLLTTAVLGSSFFNRPKKESAAKRGRDRGIDEKEYQKSLMLTPDELRQKEAHDLSLAQMQRRIERNKFLPEERFAIEPLYVKSNTPEEYKKTNRWLNYYNNPDFSGEPLVMKEGGEAKNNGFFEIEEMEYPSGIGRYISGQTKGQDDKIPAVLSDGEFVIPADIVADLGDGNNEAGAKELYKFMSNIRKHKRGGKVDLPPKAKSLSSYLKAIPKLSSSDKSLASYMRGN